jgi:choline dehydrogenase
MNMGKVLGGGSGINVMAWMRGHRNDWDFFAAESGNPAWSYESILSIYRRIEDWRGAPDPDRRGWADRSSFSPCPIPTQLHPPHSRQHDQLAFQPSTARMDGWRARAAAPSWTY